VSPTLACYTMAHWVGSPPHGAQSRCIAQADQGMLCPVLSLALHILPLWMRAVPVARCGSQREGLTVQKACLQFCLPRVEFFILLRVVCKGEGGGSWLGASNL